MMRIPALTRRPSRIPVAIRTIIMTLRRAGAVARDRPRIG